MTAIADALAGAIDRARDNAAPPAVESDEVLGCFVGTCLEPAQPEHSPCCSSTFHRKPLCCEHYCRAHFVEANPCSPDSHAAAAAASATPPKDA